MKPMFYIAPIGMPIEEVLKTEPIGYVEGFDLSDTAEPLDQPLPMQTSHSARFEISLPKKKRARRNLIKLITGLKRLPGDPTPIHNGGKP